MADRDWGRLVRDAARPLGPGEVPRFAVLLPLRRDQVRGDPREIEGSGGCMALLLLVEALGALGQEAVAIPFDELPDPGGTMATALAEGRAIAVLPEGTEGNPLRARNVVRWVLYHVSRTQVRAWRRNGDLVLCYWPHFLPAGESAETLRLLDAGLDFFVDQGRTRHGVGVHLGKGAHGHNRLDLHERSRVLEALTALPALPRIQELRSQLVRRAWERTEMPARMTRREICALFNSLALFITYDNDTALSYLAALCGCPSVVIPLAHGTPGRCTPRIRSGVAFGWAGLPDALDTMTSLRADLRRLEDEGAASVRTFLRTVSAHFPPDGAGDRSQR